MLIFFSIKKWRKHIAVAFPFLFLILFCLTNLFISLSIFYHARFSYLEYHASLMLVSSLSLRFLANQPFAAWYSHTPQTQPVLAHPVEPVPASALPSDICPSLKNLPEAAIIPGSCPRESLATPWWESWTFTSWRCGDTETGCVGSSLGYSFSVIYHFILCSSFL